MSMQSSLRQRVGRVIAVTLCSAGALLPAACSTTESSRVIEPQPAAMPPPPAGLPQYRLAIGAFENKSRYLTGMFSDGSDPVGMQARQILKTYLNQAARFALLDRDNTEQIQQEAALSGTEVKLPDAQVLVSGAVTEFGRKETGTQALGGALGKSKTQAAYGKVSISVIDARTAAVLFTAQGAGEFELTNQQVLGTGSTAGYDATLTDKVLNLAISEAVKNLVAAFDSGAWRVAEAP